MNELKQSFLRVFQSIPLQEKINFARHLSVTIESGLPLVEALRLIRKQAPSKRMGTIVDSLVNDINNGKSLSESLEKFNHVFGDFFVNLVKVGEASGNLSEILKHLSVEIKKQRELSQKVRSALIYPGVILLATIGITLFLTIFIFPKILPVFRSLNVELPFATRLVIGSLDFFRNYGLYAGAGIIVAAILFKIILSIPKIHLLYDRMVLSLPFVSKVVTNLTMASFTRSLSILLKSGMNIVEALGVSKGTFHNKFYVSQIEQIIESVKRGESVARYISNNPRFFPPMLVGMIQVGEDTGNLEQNLLYLSDYYESEVDETMKNLTAILEPMLLLFMGLAVGFIALAIITPIYKVTQGLKL